MLIKEVKEILLRDYGKLCQETRLDSVVIGKHLCGVRLENGWLGLSSTIDDSDIHCIKDKRDFGAFTPLQMEGHSVSELLQISKESASIQMLRIASINALASGLLPSQPYRVHSNTDPFDLLDIKPGSRVVLVGAFQSYIQRCDAMSCELRVLEFNEHALEPQHRKYFVPAERYTEIIPQADFLLITGLTLVNKTFDKLLSYVQPVTETVVVGPSSNLLPEVFFKHGIRYVGGTRITQPDLLFPLISQGAAGYHLFKYAAEKICISEV